MSADFDVELGEDWSDEWLDLDLDLIESVITDFVDDIEGGGYFDA